VEEDEGVGLLFNRETVRGPFPCGLARTWAAAGLRWLLGWSAMARPVSSFFPLFFSFQILVSIYWFVFSIKFKFEFCVAL
jgi:hypothetical protein